MGAGKVCGCETNINQREGDREDREDVQGLLLHSFIVNAAYILL